MEGGDKIKVGQMNDNDDIDITHINTHKPSCVFLPVHKHDDHVLLF